MNIKEKQDNEEFKVISMDPEVIKGDANKLKLLITSYAAIMEVQDAYMQEEIKTKEKEAERIETQIASGKLTEAEAKSANEELAALADRIETLSEVYAEFSESRTRFMDLAKKALRLPSENFEQLAEKGCTTIFGEKIELSSLESSYETAQKTLTDEENVDVFSNINNEDIKKEIERVINEDVVTDDKTGEEKAYKDYIPNEVDADKFDEVATKLATDAKKNIDIVKAGRILFNDALTAADAAKSNDKITAEEAQTGHEDGKEYDEEIDNQTKIIPIDIPFGDEAAVTYEGTWVKHEGTEDISFDGDMSLDNFDFSDDPEILEVAKQIEEAQGLYDSSKTILAAKDKEKEELIVEKDQKAQEAKQKFAVASEIIEKRRKEARLKAIAEKHAELEALRSELLATKDQIKAREESISNIKSEISGYQASIDKSDKVINSNGGRTK